MAEQKQTSRRDQIRGKTVGAKRQFETREVKIDDDTTVAVKQPSVGERQELFNRIRDDAGNVDQLALLSWSVIRLTLVPGTEERVFEDTDYETVLNQPTGGWVDAIGEAVLEMLNVEADEGNA